MTKRWASRASLALLVCAGTLTLPISSTTTIYASDESPCEEQLILLLIDQSTSLRENDPGNQRQKAALALIGTLATSSIPVFLAVAGFGDAYNPVGPGDGTAWLFGLSSDEADPPGAPDLESAIKMTTGNTNSNNTDYVAALLGATSFFSQVDIGGRDSSCRTLLWFTDGAYSIDGESPQTDKYTTTPSDTKSNRAKIEQEFESRICSEDQLAPSKLQSSVSEQIRRGIFNIRFIDLWIEENASTGQKAKRDATTPVIARLLAEVGKLPDEECGVPGARISVENAEDLTESFFDEGQLAAGRTKVDCERLEAGVPDSIIKSMAVLATPDTATIRVSANEDLLGRVQKTLTYPIYGLQRAGSGDVRVSVENGNLRSCFVDAGFKLEWASGDSVYGKAKSTTVAVKALGLATESGEALGDEYVDVKLTRRNGESIPMKFDSTTNRFTVQLNAPFDDGEKVRAEATLSFADMEYASAEPIELKLTVVETPPPPSAEWIGDRQIEGAGELRGEARLSTDFDVDGESKVCVTFEPESLVRDDVTGDVIGNATIDSGQQCSAPGAEALTFDVVVDFPEAQNADGTMELVYSATFQDAGLEPEVIEKTTPLEVRLSQTKPAKTGAGVLFASLLALAVAAVSYLLLFLAARFQGRLQDPARLLIAEADVRTETASGGRSRLQGSGRFQASDLKRVTQDGSGYAVGPLTIKRTWPFNPLAEIHAVLTCKDGTVMCDPSMTKTAKPGRRAAIPTRFDELVAAHVRDGQVQLYVLMRAGATGDDFQRAMDLSLSRLEQRIRSALLEGERSDRQPSPSRATSSAVTADETSTVSSVRGAAAPPYGAPPRPPRPPMPPSRSQER